MYCQEPCSNGICDESEQSELSIDKQTQALLDMLGSTSESASLEGSSDLDCVIQVKNLSDVSPLKLMKGYELIDEDLYIDHMSKCIHSIYTSF